MGSGPLEHLAADGATACEKDVIERQGHQRCCDGSIPQVHPNHLRLEVLRNQTADQGRDGWCVFGWLQHRRVSGRKGADQGLKGQREGIVPRTDDQDAAQGLWDHIRSARALGQRHRDAPRAHPSAQLALGQLQFLAQRNDFEEGLGGRFAQIRCQGCQHILFVLLDQVAEALKLLLSPGRRSSETTPHAVLHAAEFVDGQGHRADD